VHLFVYVPFIACAVGVASARMLARRTDPRVASRVLVATGLVLGITSAVALSLLAFGVIARVPLVAAHGHWAASAVGGKVRVPAWIGLVALGCVGAIVANAVHMLGDHCRRLNHAVRLQLEGGGRIITVSDGGSFAYACRALPFRPGVIIVSDGLQRTLDTEQRAAVLAHERSHLDHQHNLYELGALLTTALNPLLSPIARELRFCLERWADEDAAAVQGRGVAASALAVSALHRPRAVPRLGAAHADNCVPARVRALIDEPAPRGRIWMGSAVVNALLAAVAVVLAAHSTELIFEALRR
jgi:hypothetical protein